MGFRWPASAGFSDVPIRRKLILLALLSSALGMVFAATILVTHTWNSTHNAAIRDLATLTRIAADNTTAALVFSDPRGATETLAALKAKPEVESACLYQSVPGNGSRLFAHYSRADLKCPPTAPPDLLTERDGTLSALVAVVLAGDNLGTLYVTQNTQILRKALGTQVAIAIGIFIISFLISAVFAGFMQRAITHPILRLAATAQRVSETRDYHLRVDYGGQDEIGRLIGDFNRMLGYIESSDREVQNARDALSGEVRQKTRANEQLEQTLQRLKDAQELVRATVASAVDGIIVIDAQGIIHAFNPAAERMFGYSAKEALGQNVKLLMPQPYAGEHDSYLQNYLHSGIKKIIGIGREVSGRRRDGSVFPLDLGVSEMSIGHERRFAGIVRDITQRKQQELELRRLNESLGRQVTETVNAMTRLKEAQIQLVQSEKLASLGALVAGVAHEINTPVGIGVTAASTLEARAQKLKQLYETGALTRSELERFVAMADESCHLILKNLQRAADLIQGFKQVAVDQSSSERRRFSLKAYLEEVLMSLSPKIKKSRHRVEVSCPNDLSVDSHPGAIAQIVTNFITNSLLHGYDDGVAGHLRIEVSQRDGWVTLIYRDDGRGIPPEHREKVFDPFFTTRRGVGGSGLGLHIVYNLVTSMLGGTIQLNSNAGNGVEFVIRFPAALQKEAA